MINIAKGVGAATTWTLSNLDNPTLLQLGTKDGINIAGRTIMAKKESGDHEAREKFIEEVGTSVLWLGGIPACRWLINKTFFKAAGIDPKLSLENLAKKEAGNSTKKFGKQAIKVSENIIKKYKWANFAKTMVSIGIPFYLLASLVPKLNQNLTKKLVFAKALKDEKQNKQEESQKNIGQIPQNKNLQMFEKFFAGNSTLSANSTKASFVQSDKKQNLSFKGWGSLLNEINPMHWARTAQVDPFMSMVPMDVGISANRVFFISRNKQEKVERAIVEGGTLFFLFYASDLINKALNKVTTTFGYPINVDFNILGNETFKNSMKKPEEFKKQISAFKNYEGGCSQYIKENFGKSEDFFVNSAIKLGIVKPAKQKEKAKILKTMKKIGAEISETELKTNKHGILDPRKHINEDSLKRFATDLETLADGCANKNKNGNFLRNVKLMKVGAVATNLAICCGALGYALPKIQYYVREKVFGSKEFPGTKGYEEEAKKLSHK